MINKVILVGNLGADPESRSTNSGNTVVNMRIATTERRKNQEGEYEPQTEWHNVVCFGKTADNVAKYCKKGRQLYVEGRLQTRKWQDRDGNDRWSTEVVAFTVQFLGGREDREDSSGGGGSYGGGGGSKSGGGDSGGGDSGGGSKSSSGGKSGGDMPYNNDDIPF